MVAKKCLRIFYCLKSPSMSSNNLAYCWDLSDWCSGLQLHFPLLRSAVCGRTFSQSQPYSRVSYGHSGFLPYLSLVLAPVEPISRKFELFDLFHLYLLLFWNFHLFLVPQINFLLSPLEVLLFRRRSNKWMQDWVKRIGFMRSQAPLDYIPSHQFAPWS